MVVDSSAIVAILHKERGWRSLVDAVRAAPRPIMSAATLVEAGMVIEVLRGKAGAVLLDRMLARFGVEIVPFDTEQAAIAREAFRHFGKGRHPAALNFGDCLTYALAKLENAPLLFVGADFARTDIMPALPG
jgi:ribonuclease VapC